MITATGIKCDICGKFIRFDDLDEQKATHKLFTPSSEFTSEEWDSYHNECLKRSQRRGGDERP